MMSSASSVGNFSTLNYQYFLPVVSSILPKYDRRYIGTGKLGVNVSVFPQ